MSIANMARATGMISLLADESPAMAFGKREHVDEGKGARRNSRLLPNEGSEGSRRSNLSPKRK
ncbi:MAG TPA: hypothetical protein ENK06_14885 [Gammaproteobacteria bacterium]|nr:hypothetical protein [Gammaproteobacteria bacterium]